MTALLAEFTHLSDPAVSRAVIRRALGHGRHSAAGDPPAGPIALQRTDMPGPLGALAPVHWLLSRQIPIHRRPVDHTWAYLGFLPHPPRWAHCPDQPMVLLPGGSMLERWLQEPGVPLHALNFRGRLISELIDAIESPLLVLALRSLQGSARGRVLWGDTDLASRARLYAYAWGAAKLASRVWMGTRVLRLAHDTPPGVEDRRFLSPEALDELGRIGMEADSPAFLVRALRPLVDGTMELAPSALLRAPALFRWFKEHLRTMAQLPTMALAYVQALHGRPMPDALPAAGRDDLAMLEALALQLWSAVSQPTYALPPAPSTPSTPSTPPTPPTIEEARPRPALFDPRFVDWRFSGQFETWRAVPSLEALVARIHALDFLTVPAAVVDEIAAHLDSERVSDAHRVLARIEPVQAPGDTGAPVPCFLSST